MEKLKPKSIGKLEIRDFVMFPRTQLKGLQPQDVDRGLFTPQAVDDGHGGTLWMLRQNAAPHMLFQVIITPTPEKFDNALGMLLGMPDNPIYIEGCTDFITVFQGAHDHVEVTPDNYKQVSDNIKEMHHTAARWWYQYGKETIKAAS